MVGICEAISRLGNAARLDGRPLPTICVPAIYLIQLARIIEDDIGGSLFFSRDLIRGFQYDGVRFCPYPKPRVRVKAGRAVVYR